MRAQYYPYQQLTLFSDLIQDYIKEHPSLKKFYSYTPDIKGFEKKIEEYTFKGNRKILVDTLQQQYQGFELSNESQANIDLLSKNNTFTITTGHQLNLFTGPLYFIFKIASTIKLCKDLSAKFPDKNFVPVYWMATEDHDFEEINHTYLDDKKIVWQQEHHGAVGRMTTDQLTKTVKEYQAFLGAAPHATTLSEIVKKAYLEHNTLSNATRYLVNKLFGTQGLVILDADTPALKALFSNFIFEDIREQKSARAIENSNSELNALGYKIQVQPRAINFFYLDNKIRERIVFEEEKYRVLHTDITFTEEELQRSIQDNPEKFSPNVVMRPLYQEIILPNLAYIGGSGEIAYWLQLKANFEQYDIDFPILIVRNSAIWIDSIAHNYWKNLGLGIDAVFSPIEVLQKEFVAAKSTNNLSLSTQIAQLQNLMKDVKTQAAQINNTLPISADALQTKVEHLMQSFEKKLLKGEKRNFDDGIRQLEKFKHRLFPNGGLQERKQNFAIIYKNYGQEWILFLIENFRPLAKEITLIFES